MTETIPCDDLFFAETGLERDAALRLTEDALINSDDGELFLEYCQSENLVFDDGQLRTASFDVNQGFGLRAVCGETSAYAHSAELSQAALARAADTVRSIQSGSGDVSAAPPRTNVSLYSDDNPVQAMAFEDKVRLLQEVDGFARNLDDRVRQVTVSLSGEWQAVDIIRPGGHTVSDRRPLVRFNVSVVTGQGKNAEAAVMVQAGAQITPASLLPATGRPQHAKPCGKVLWHLRQKMPRPEKWMLSLAPAGRVSCYTKPLVTGLRGISTARRRPRSPA